MLNSSPSPGFGLDKLTFRGQTAACQIPSRCKKFDDLTWKEVSVDPEQKDMRSVSPFLPNPCHLGRVKVVQRLHADAGADMQVGAIRLPSKLRLKSTHQGEWLESEGVSNDY